MPIDKWLRHSLLAGLLLLASCSHYYYDLGDPLSAQAVPDNTRQVTLGEALDLLGPPQRISATATGFVLAWEHWDIRETNLGFSLGFAGVKALSVDWGKARVQGEFMLLAFDEHHVLTDSAFTEWDNIAGGGQALQPLGGLIPVVDVDDLLESMPQHRWGAASLDDLPITLNSDSRPDTGQNGIEQRGTPTAVGQHSLEME
jgi:hypothetical protein